MEHTVKCDMVVADLIVQGASTHFMFSILLENGYGTKNISSTSSIQYALAKKLGMRDATRVQVEKLYVPLQEII